MEYSLLLSEFFVVMPKPKQMRIANETQPSAPPPPSSQFSSNAGHKLLDISLLRYADKSPPFEGNTAPPTLSVVVQAVQSDDDVLFNSMFPRYVFNRHYYKFVKTLGSGAFATVVEAEWLPRNQKVAVKMIEKQKAKGDEASIKNELEILCKVDHPNLLRMFDWGFGRKTIYIVTELYSFHLLLN
jgi:hypothetical protein